MSEYVKPNNMTAFIAIITAVIVYTISIGFLFYRLPNITLPTAEELYEIENIKKNRPPVYEGTILRDLKNPFPNFYGSTINVSDAYNKTDFDNLYNTHIKPSLEEKLLNNKFLILDKKSTVTDLMVSLLFSFVGLFILYIGIQMYLTDLRNCKYGKMGTGMGMDIGNY